jgi:hypothetical protein
MIPGTIGTKIALFHKYNSSNKYNSSDVHRVCITTSTASRVSVTRWWGWCSGEMAAPAITPKLKWIKP